MIGVPAIALLKQPVEPGIHLSGALIGNLQSAVRGNPKPNLRVFRAHALTDHRKSGIIRLRLRYGPQGHGLHPQGGQILQQAYPLSMTSWEKRWVTW